MNEYKVYIEDKWIDGTARVFVHRLAGENNREYLTMNEGKVISNTISRCELTPENSYLLELPQEVFKSIEQGIIERIERRGGAPTQQMLRGEIKRLEDEVKWLRDQYSNLFYRNNTLPVIPN